MFLYAPGGKVKHLLPVPLFRARQHLRQSWWGSKIWGLPAKEEWYIGNVESFPEDSVEKEVVVAVNGEEARVVFIDHQYGAMKLENLVATYDPHAFLVVLAVDDVASLATVSALKLKKTLP